MDPDIFDHYCVGFGDCGLGYAVWEKNSRGGAYAPKFFSDEVVWSYENVTFVAMDCRASSFESLHAYLELWMSQKVVHSYDVYNAMDHGGMFPMFSSDSELVPGQEHVRTMDDFERNRQIMSTIPVCVNSDQPKCGRLRNSLEVMSYSKAQREGMNVLKHGLYVPFGLEDTCWPAAKEAFDGDVEKAKLAFERCFTRKDSLHARTIAAKNALTKMGSTEHDAMVALLKCSGQTRLCCDVASIYRRFNATPR